MTNNINKIALATMAGLCAFGYSAKGFGLDAELHANFQDGIGANVNADVGLAQANVGTNVGLNGVDANVGADVIGIGANTAAHAGFDGVTGRAHTYVGPLANAGVNAGATWRDGVYAGATAHVFERPNTAVRALSNGQTIYLPSQPAPQGQAWIYGNNGRVVGYQPAPRAEQVVQTVMQPRVDYVMPATQSTVYQQTQPVRIIRRRIIRQVPVAMESSDTEIHNYQFEGTSNDHTTRTLDYREINDASSGYHFVDSRKVVRRVVRRTGYEY